MSVVVRNYLPFRSLLCMMYVNITNLLTGSNGPEFYCHGIGGNGNTRHL